jgi:hypothetical protein
VAVCKHGVVEGFEQLVDSGRLVSHLGGKGLLGKAGHACVTVGGENEGRLSQISTSLETLSR